MPDAEIVPRAGFYGKLPARGDFLRAGLPRGFVETWDGWLQRVIAGSRAALGTGWVAAWMEAPIWRFALPPGLCGEDAVLGLWMPSVDRAGRHFPLTAALVLPDAASMDDARAAAWMARAEEAALEALMHDLPPDALGDRLAAAWVEGPGVAADLSPVARGLSVWWTDGAPLVPPGRMLLPGLPDIARFAAMLDSRTASGEGKG
jgi:type VI secretion system protein ImpM